MKFVGNKVSKVLVALGGGEGAVAVHAAPKPSARVLVARAAEELVALARDGVARKSPPVVAPSGVEQLAQPLSRAIYETARKDVAIHVPYRTLPVLSTVADLTLIHTFG